MSELFETKQFGVRENSKVVAVVITDGRSNDSPLVRSGQERLKKIVDVVIAVGVNMKKEVNFWLFVSQAPYVSILERALKRDQLDCFWSRWALCYWSNFVHCSATNQGRCQGLHLHGYFSATLLYARYAKSWYGCRWFRIRYPCPIQRSWEARPSLKSRTQCPGTYCRWQPTTNCRWSRPPTPRPNPYPGRCLLRTNVSFYQYFTMLNCCCDFAQWLWHNTSYQSSLIYFHYSWVLTWSYSQVFNANFCCQTFTASRNISITYSIYCMK